MPFIVCIIIYAVSNEHMRMEYEWDTIHDLDLVKNVSRLSNVRNTLFTRVLGGLKTAFHIHILLRARSHLKN